MGMSTRVEGFISSDNETYRKHSAVLRACIDAEVSCLPKETAEYFGSEYPSEYLLEDKLIVDIPKREYTEDMTEGFEILISDIPEGVEMIRFANSW